MDVSGVDSTVPRDRGDETEEELSLDDLSRDTCARCGDSVTTLKTVPHHKEKPDLEKVPAKGSVKVPTQLQEKVRKDFAITAASQGTPRPIVGSSTKELAKAMVRPRPMALTRRMQEDQLTLVHLDC